MNYIDTKYAKLVRYIRVTWSDCFADIDEGRTVDPRSAIGYTMNEVEGLLYQSEELTFCGFIELCLLTKNQVNDKELVKDILVRLMNDLSLDSDMFAKLYISTASSIWDGELKRAFVKKTKSVIDYLNEDSSRKGSKLKVLQFT